MGVLSFDGTNDTVKSTSLSSALSNVSAGAFTMAWLVRTGAIAAGSDFEAFGYLLSGSGSGTVQMGLSVNSSDALQVDVSGFPASTITVADNDVCIYVIRKASGLVALTYSEYVRSTTLWSHHSPGSLANQSAATMLELGAWQTADNWAGHMGLFGAWNAEMSQAQVETLDDSWQTSTWWNNGVGNPVSLIELNTTTPTDIGSGGGAASLTVNGATLDGAQTLDSWNFNGTGAAAATSLVWQPYSPVIHLPV